MNRRDWGTFLSYAWMLQKQRSQKLHSAKVSNLSLREDQFTNLKIYILLSSTFQGKPSLLQLCFAFQSPFLCRENKISNITVTFEIVSVAKCSIRSWHLGRGGDEKKQDSRMDKKAGSFISGSEKVMHLHLIWGERDCQGDKKWIKWQSEIQTSSQLS